MTLSELKTLLSTSGIPVYYSHVKESQTLPFIVYKYAYSHNFKADNKVFYQVSHIDITLYTKTKSSTNETTLETIFDNNCLVWSKIETYLESEQCYQMQYEIEI